MRAAALSFLLASTAPAAETVVSARLLGGRHFAQGRSASLSGSASGKAAAALPAGERWTLFPTLAGSWSGVESALDAAGGGTLFSESMEHRAGLKAVYRPERGRWRLKSRAGWRARLLRETKDEAWLDGLFDHHTVDAGLDLERETASGAVSLGYSFSRTLFPNFESLESEAPSDPKGRPLARELAGKGVLDSDAHLVTAGLEASLPRGFSLAGRLGLESRDFLDQRLVRSDGLLDAATRSDLTAALEAELSAAGEPRPDLRLSGTLGLAFSQTQSDQASYDPARARYEPRHYDRVEWSAGPSLAASWGDPRAPAALSAGLRYGRRRWPHRSARDGTGAYSGAALLEETWAASAEGRWPLAPGLALLARLERRWARANDHFEGLYRFNHDATALLVGVALER